jgi:MFS family permease
MLLVTLVSAAAGGDKTSATLPSSPDASQLPGAQTLSNLANGIGGWALVAAVVGIVVGAILWAFGHYSQNYQQAYNGRRGVMVSGLAALLIGAAPKVVDFFLTQGKGLH